MTQQIADAKPHPRISINQSATVEDGNGSKFTCSVIDVSQEGFRIKIARILVPGSNYILHLDHEAHRIEIRWASPGEAGGLFLEKLV